jgi:hypothetical protein
MTEDIAPANPTLQAAADHDVTIDPVRVTHGVTVFIAADQPTVVAEQNALDLLGESWQSQAEVLVVPASRLDGRFFDLTTGLAGAVLQKFVNYRMQVAIVGDIAEYLATSNALRAFVIESNRGQQVWFLDDLDQLANRLALRG